MVFPWPAPDPAEQQRIRDLNAAAREIGSRMDHRKIEEKRWIGDDVIRELGAAGLCGLYVDEAYGGQGLSQTGYARVFETFAQIDATLSIVLGVHQSIGFKGIHMFGSDEQKERFLPDLAPGRKLAGFALTEPEAGSDAYEIKSRAVQQPDGSWVLNGEKRYIGNGSKGDVFTAFARCEIDGKDRHIALILEQGMKGFEVGERFDTMGLRGNDLRRLYFNDVKVPAENVLGEPGDGFRIAMSILNNGRIGLGTGSVGATKRLIDLAIAHVKERRQFGRPLAEFELVQDKIAWMVSYLFGLESMCYLTCGLVDRGVEDYSLESAICKVAGTEFLWYAANRAMQLKGGAGYMRDEPYEKILRDIRIFPIFEGANDVMRAFVALSGMKPVGEKLSGLGEIGLGDPIGSIGVLADYVGGRIRDRGAAGTGDGSAPRAQATTPTRFPIRSASCTTAPSRCCASTRANRRRPVPAEADLGRDLGHLRPDRRALASDLDLRGPGRRALRAGAVTSPTPSAPAPPAGSPRTSSRSPTTTTSARPRSPSSPTSAASTDTRCSRTDRRLRQAALDDRLIVGRLVRRGVEAPNDVSGELGRRDADQRRGVLLVGLRLLLAAEDGELGALFEVTERHDHARARRGLVAVVAATACRELQRDDHGRAARRPLAAPISPDQLRRSTIIASP